LQKILYCSDDECKGPVKPNIVFFGEQLPKEFFKAIEPKSLLQIDLLLVMGTALAV
jgi:NAD-dependent SIR2 family protein deacetylase